jgi:hypothetical protein
MTESMVAERLASLEADMKWVKQMHFIEIISILITLVAVVLKG